MFAAEGPGVRVDARQVGDNWLLTGTKPWCSLADRLSHALITAHTGEGTRRLFAISLRGATIRATADVWVAKGLVNVPSGPIDLEDCAAVPVGPDGWYLRRPGFAWGGIGVAACWYGGAVGIARTLRNAMSSKPPDQIATMHLGAVDAALTAARAVLGAAAAQIDGGSVTAAEGVVARRPGACGRRERCRGGDRSGRDTHSGRRRWRWTSVMPGGSPICPCTCGSITRSGTRLRWDAPFSSSTSGCRCHGTITDTSFDHRHVGTGAQEWSATGLIDNASVLDLVGLRRLIVVAAHPDDESLGAGGLIATAARRGVPVTVVVATTGEASHPQSPTLRPAQLAPIRRAEVLAAVHRLAPQAMVVQLDLGDSRLGASVDALAGEIRSVIDGVVDHAVAADGAASAPAGGDEVWLAAPWRHDRHADHAAAAEAARLVAAATGCRLLEFPLWAWHWGRPTDSPFADHPLLALELSEEVVRAKDLAMSEHRSQTEPLSAAAGDEPVVGPAFAEHFGRSREMFIDGHPDQSRPAVLRRLLFRRARSVGFREPVVREAQTGAHHREPAEGKVCRRLRTGLRHRGTDRRTRRTLRESPGHRHFRTPAAAGASPARRISRCPVRATAGAAGMAGRTL